MEEASVTLSRSNTIAPPPVIEWRSAKCEGVMVETFTSCPQQVMKVEAHRVGSAPPVGGRTGDAQDIAARRSPVSGHYQSRRRLRGTCGLGVPRAPEGHRAAH